MRPAGEAEDTARLDDDARHARRLAIDRQTQGCVADETNRKGVGPGVSRACPVDPLARLQIILDRAQAWASAVSSLQSTRWPLSMPVFWSYWLVDKTGTLGMLAPASGIVTRMGQDGKGNALSGLGPALPD